jgi:hypothetical protein
MTADDEGNFEGHLPNEGPWRVEVQLLEVDGAQAADKTEIRRKPGESYAEVEIRLPDTRVSGLVLRDNRPAEAFVVGIIERDGRSVPEAAAVARRQFSVATESDGSFEVRGLSPGKIRVFAHDGERQSDKVLVELVDGVDPQELMLELAVMEDIYGALVDQGNGVPGAAIMVVPEKGVRRQTTTDWTGSFQTRVRADSSYVNLIVVPPAGGVFVQRVSTGRESKEIVLFLRREEGNLLVPSDTLSTLHYVFSGGSMVPLQPLGSALTGYSRVAVEDGDVLFAGLSPGVWNLCPHPVLDPSSCHTVEVLQGQTARLQRMEERE